MAKQKVFPQKLAVFGKASGKMGRHPMSGNVKGEQ